MTHDGTGSVLSMRRHCFPQASLGLSSIVLNKLQQKRLTMTAPNNTASNGVYANASSDNYFMKQARLGNNNNGDAGHHKENRRETLHPGAATFRYQHQQNIRIKREYEPESKATMNDMLEMPIPKRARLPGSNNNSSNNNIFGGLEVSQNVFTGMTSPALGNHPPPQVQALYQPNMISSQLGESPTSGHSFSAVNDDDNSKMMLKLATKRADVQANTAAFWEARLEERALDEKRKSLKNQRSDLKEKLKNVRAELQATGTAWTQASEMSSALETKKNASQREYDTLVTSIVGGPADLFVSDIAVGGRLAGENSASASAVQRGSTVSARSTAPSRRSSEAHAIEASRKGKKMNRDTLIKLALDSEHMEDAKATLIDYVTNASIADLRRGLHLPSANHVRGIAKNVALNLVRVLSRGKIHLQPEFRKRLEKDKALKLMLCPAHRNSLLIKKNQEGLHSTLIQCLELA